MGLFKKITSSVPSNIKREMKEKVTKAIQRFKLNATNKVINSTSTKSFEEFNKRWDVDGKDHIKTIMLYLIAALEYTKGNKDGEAMASLLLPTPRLHKNPKSPSGWALNKPTELFFLEHMKENPNTPKSYLGGTPQNNYEIDENNLKLHVVQEGVKDREAVVVIQSAGKDFSSPCGLRLNKDGYWKIFKGTGSIATQSRITDEEMWDF